MFGPGSHVSAIFRPEEVEVVVLPFKLTAGVVGELRTVARYLPRGMVVGVFLLFLDGKIEEGLPRCCSRSMRVSDMSWFSICITPHSLLTLAT